MGGGILAAAAAGPAAEDVPSPKLKKLFLSSSGGGGRAPGNPGTCGTANIGPPPALAMASCFPCDFPQRIDNFLPFIVNLLKVFSAAASAEDLLVYWKKGREKIQIKTYSRFKRYFE